MQKELGELGGPNVEAGARSIAWGWEKGSGCLIVQGLQSTVRAGETLQVPGRTPESGLRKREPDDSLLTQATLQ